MILVMPFRPGLDDDPDLNELIRIWREGSADIDRRLAKVFEDIRAELSKLGEDRNRLTRLVAQVDRLEDLQDVAEAILDDLLQGTKDWVNGRKMHTLYAKGAEQLGVPFSFTLPHRRAINILARDTYADVLAMTELVDLDAKEFVRRVSRKLTGFKLTSGTPVKTQARRFRTELSREFNRRGVGVVTYANGRRTSFGEYAEMLLRTKSGQAYNSGTTNASRLAGVTHVELLDGSLCGLTAHNDPNLANGLIVPIQVAVDWPLSHPNCRRAIVPRPDVSAANAPSAPSVVSAERRADQTAFEAALRAEAQERRRRAQNGSNRRSRGSGRRVRSRG